MSMKTVPILFTFDSSLLMPAGVCLTSLLESAAEGTFYDIFILHGTESGLDGSGLERLADRYGNCRITFRTVENEFTGAYEIRGIPETAYYRLVAPELIPEYGKILYSDVDVIFREDLSGYYGTDLGDNYFAGVDNCSALRPDVQDYLAGTLGLDYRKGYYYSGNLVINSELLLRDGKLDEFRRLGRNDYLQQDMDIINIACNGRILPLDPGFCLTNYLYNLIVTRGEQMEALWGKSTLDHALRSGIVHYNGAKPWKEACMNMDLWWGCYRRSVFFDEDFCRDFWNRQCSLLQRLPLAKRLKTLLRWPLDARHRT